MPPEAIQRPRRAGRGMPLTGEQCKRGLIDYALAIGYHVHWTDDSRRTDTGWPDILCIGYGTVIAIECKSRGEPLSPGKTTRKGRRMPSQAEWLTAIGGTAGCAAYVCRPRRDDLQWPEGDWEEVDYDAMLTVLTTARDRAIGR